MDSYLCYQKLELSEESSLRYKEQLSVRKYSLPKDYAFDIKAETASVFTKFKADSPRYEEGYDWCAYLTINDENSRFVDYYLILEADKVTLHVIYSKIQWERGLSPYIDRS